MESMKIKYHLTDEAIVAGCKFEQPRDGDAGYDICVFQGSRNTSWVCIPAAYWVACRDTTRICRNH